MPYRRSGLGANTNPQGPTAPSLGLILEPVELMAPAGMVVDLFHALFRGQVKEIEVERILIRLLSRPV